MKTLKRFFSMSVILAVFTLLVSCPFHSDNGERGISGMELVLDMGIGVNIGNTLDAIGTSTWHAGETGWGNPVICRGFIAALREHGFRTVRLPVTWVEYMGPGPDYLIAETRMARVEEVIGWILEENMYVILNMHHDGGGAYRSWIRDMWRSPEDEARVIRQFELVWTQIATRFRDALPDKLLLQSMNEVGFDELWNRWVPGQIEEKAEAYRLLNRLNQTFVDTVRTTGGGNSKRFLVVQGYWTDIENTVDPLFIMPTDTVTDRLILSIHYYTPWNFVDSHSGPQGNRIPNNTVWGTQTQRNQLNNLFEKLRPRFLDHGIPIILGEYGIYRGATTPEREEAIFEWTNAVTRTALKMGIAPILWCVGTQHTGVATMGYIDRRPPFNMNDTLRRVMDGNLIRGTR